MKALLLMLVFCLQTKSEGIFSILDSLYDDEGGLAEIVSQGLY